jgi:hypothetical protein
MILIDECVDPQLSRQLISEVLNELICISGNKSLVGVSDIHIESFAYYYRALLITKDVSLFKSYRGPKLLLKNNGNSYDNHDDLPIDLLIDEYDWPAICRKIIELKPPVYNELVAQGLIKPLKDYFFKGNGELQ